MIDAVAKALAGWAVPHNDWDSMAEEQREAEVVWQRMIESALTPADG